MRVYKSFKNLKFNKWEKRLKFVYSLPEIISAAEQFHRNTDNAGRETFRKNKLIYYWEYKILNKIYKNEICCLKY
jgi:hypothetical protein